MRNALRQILHMTEGFAKAAKIEGQRIAAQAHTEYKDETHWYEGAEALEERFLRLEEDFNAGAFEQARAFLEAEMAFDKLVHEDHGVKPEVTVE